MLLSPLLATLAALLSPLAGGRRPVRLLALVLAWAGGHLLSVVACWLVHVTRDDRGRYYAVMRWFVGAIAQTALRVGRVKVTVYDSERAEAVLTSETPVVLLSDPLRRRRLAARARSPAAPPSPAAADRDAPGAGGDPLIDMIGTQLPTASSIPAAGTSRSRSRG